MIKFLKKYISKSRKMIRNRKKEIDVQFLAKTFTCGDINLESETTSMESIKLKSESALSSLDSSFTNSTNLSFSAMLDHLETL